MGFAENAEKLFWQRQSRNSSMKAEFFRIMPNSSIWTMTRIPQKCGLSNKPGKSGEFQYKEKKMKIRLDNSENPKCYLCGSVLVPEENDKRWRTCPKCGRVSICNEAFTKEKK